MFTAVHLIVVILITSMFVCLFVLLHILAVYISEGSGKGGSAHSNLHVSPSGLFVHSSALLWTVHTIYTI